MKKVIKQSQPAEELPVGTLLRNYAKINGMLDNNISRVATPVSLRLKSPTLPEKKLHPDKS